MAKGKSLSIKVDGDNIMYSNISKSKDGYNSCRVVAKVGEKEYMSISYEWEGSGVPDFCMDLMGFMKAHQLEFSNEKHCRHCKNPVSKCDCMDGPHPTPDDSDETHAAECACDTCKQHNPEKKMKKKSKDSKKKDDTKEDE